MTKKSTLLEEAIADAKAVRETALENAKQALQEAFTPKIQSILTKKIQQEIEDADEDEDIVDNEPLDVDVDEDVPVDDEEDVDIDIDVEDDDDEFTEDVDFEDEDEDDEEDLDLEQIIKELEDEEDVDLDIEDDDDEFTEDVDFEDEDDEEIDIDEVLNSLKEDDDEDIDIDIDDDSEEDYDEDEMEEIKKQRNEAYKVIKTLKDQLNEVNLINAKLLYINKLFKKYDLSENQKLKVVDNFDRTSSLREAKLVYVTISESFKNGTTKRKISESFASDPQRRTEIKENIISQGETLKDKFQRLANINKK